MKKKMICLLTLVLLLLSACGSNEMAPASEMAAPAASPAPSMDFAAEPAESADTLRASIADSAPMAEAAELPSDAMFALTESEEAERSYFNLPILTPENAGDRRLIYTVDIHLQTTEFLSGMRLLLDTVADSGGYLMNASVRGSDLRAPRPTEQNAVFRFRVPTEELAHLIFVIENNYNIWNLDQDMQEQTAVYQSTDWTINDLREEEADLRELLEEANLSEEERAIVSNRLTDISRRIRELEAGQQNIMHNVIYSTVDIQLSEAFLYEPMPTDADPVILALVAVSLMLIAAILIIMHGRREKKITLKQNNIE